MYNLFVFCFQLSTIHKITHFFKKVNILWPKLLFSLTEILVTTAFYPETFGFSIKFMPQFASL